MTKNADEDNDNNNSYEQNAWNISLNSSFNEKSLNLLGKNLWFKGNDVYVYQYKDITIIGYGRIYNEMDLWMLIINTPPPKEKTHSLQIVIELYKKIGFEKTLEYLDGDFSFILFDMNLYGDESLLYVVRDYLGLMSMYQWISNINKKVQFVDDTCNENSNQYLFSSSIISSDNMINEPIINGTYMIFTHSFKVSANWKHKSTIHYYKLPFHSTYVEDNVNKTQYLLEIEKAFNRKLRYITPFCIEDTQCDRNEIGIIRIQNDGSPSQQDNTINSHLMEYLDKNTINYKIISFVVETEEKYPTIIQKLKQTLNNNDPFIIRAYFIPLMIAKYIKEKEPQIKYVLMTEFFIYKWININIFDRREELNSVFFRERLNGWTDAFFEYGIDLIIPYLDRTLLQKI